jgi:hypothetical protein
MGTTRHLKEYFDNIAEQKAEFKTSREFVEHLILGQMADGNTVSSSSGGHDDSAAATADGEGEVNVKIKRRKVDASSCEPPFSELSRIEELYNAVHDVSLIKLLRTEQKGKVADEVSVIRIGRDFLIGKICKIYCANDNQYHTGRIMNWRSALEPGISPDVSNQYFYGEGEIGCTEFLVRFPAGLDGRKETLLQWVILEEHATAISSAVILAMKKKGKGLMSGWEHGQLMLRSCIELIPVRHIVSKCDHYGLVAFFDLETNIYLDLKLEAMGVDCEMVQNLLKAQKSDTRGTHGTRWEIFEQYAKAEIQEQERTKRWSRLYLKNQYHPKAFTLLDEYSSDLIVNNEGLRAFESKRDDDGNLMPKATPGMFSEINLGTGHFEFADANSIRMKSDGDYRVSSTLPDGTVAFN